MYLREYSISSPLLSVSVVLLFLLNSFTLHTLHSTPTPIPTANHLITLASNTTSSCKFPLVYNKPHKTGSTTVQRALSNWAKEHNRTFVSCSDYIDKASLQLRECLKPDPSGCAVIATHIVLDRDTKVLLTERFGSYKLLTSTRRARSRILSAFLQYHWTKARYLRKEDEVFLREFLDSFNPWTLYNYHTGLYREGACPLSEEGRHAVAQLAKTFDVVVDVDLVKQSEAILEHWGLCRLGGIHANTRGAADMRVPDDVERRLKEVSCVEEELHRLLRLRMASLYEKATGKNCLLGEREPTTCFPDSV
eukprot:GFKZ01011730.1.p1 GENE.GFKZ01011730.1~~GFKZ01011730.1.p1  ORF type:complete len:331 (-),score=34.68 GFKZ01011730.1:44-964(-)